jgi:hypothetical protein
MAENRIKKIYESMGKFPAKGMREIDVPKADTSSFLERRKMLGASAKDIASALVRSSPIGRAGRVAGKALKAAGLLGAGYAAGEAEDVIREKIEKKKSGGAVFIPRGQKAFQVNKQKSRIL